VSKTPKYSYPTLFDPQLMSKLQVISKKSSKTCIMLRAHDLKAQKGAVTTQLITHAFFNVYHFP